MLLVCGVVGLDLTVRSARRGRPVLRLSPDGTWGRFTNNWVEVTDIVGVAPRGKAFRPVVLERKDGAPAVINNAAAWSPGGRALFRMIRHYWLHREDRAELVNGVAVERLTAGRFAAE